MGEGLNNIDTRAVLEGIPAGVYVLTAAHDHDRSGTLVHWVQRCSVEPPMLMVALPKGQPIVPLIRDSRSFALCRIAEDDFFLMKKFGTPPDRSEDPFVTLRTMRAVTGSPILFRAKSYLDCEVVRHLDFDTDHRLYVAQVLRGGVLPNGHLGGMNGSSPHAASDEGHGAMHSKPSA
jgi:flavin reductase (DIM6/NTAB) family NADH-FMN oxidoreductase RutF